MFSNFICAFIIIIINNNSNTLLFQKQVRELIVLLHKICCPCSYLIMFMFSTDNGPHYHNTGFLLYLSEVNVAFNLTLVEYNNFEAGEGKSMLDTHFAHISHKIVRWVRIGNNLETGNQLGELIGVS